MASASNDFGLSAASSPAPSSPRRRSMAVTFSNTVAEHDEKSPSLISLLNFSAYQQQQLLQSWPRLQRSGGHSSGAEVFRKLILKNTAIKETFQKANIVCRFSRSPGYDIYKEHGKLLFEILQTAVKSLNDSSADELIEICAQYGAKHGALRGASAGFKKGMWDDFSEVLMEHVTRSEAVRGRREAVRAWTSLIMFVVEKMKDGYEGSFRKTLPSDRDDDLVNN